MCDPCASVISCAREVLIPLARDNVLPFARKYLFSFALDHLVPILKESVNMIRGLPNDEIAHMKHQLETIEDAIHQADKMADAEGVNPSDGTREKMKQLIEAYFRIQDVIDEYIIREEQQLPDPGCAAGASDYVKTKKLRLQIAHDIQIIKSKINEMKDTSTEKDHGFQIKSSKEQGSNTSGVNPNAKLLQKHRKAALFMQEEDVLGCDDPKKQLIDWVVNGSAKRTVVSVIAMGGQGKTTLAKQVYDNTKVIQHFESHVWITVSQQYNAEGLLREMLQKLYKEKGNNLPEGINQMHGDSLVDEVRNFLQKKSYVIVFDDVWDKNFWGEIELAMIDNKNGSKIIITTRNMDVVNACNNSSGGVHKLEALTKEKSLELFDKRAFHNLKGGCPENLMDISSKIVEKCNGLPLAIVVIGDLLRFKDRNAFQWLKFSEQLNSESKKDSVVSKILALSYHDLSYNLKSCLLYFGIYPEDCEVKSKRLIRQWIAEGFIKEEEGMTLEEVAEGYLTELIHRSLVQVVSINIDGRAKTCRVHDLVHDMILKKFEDLCFCKNISEDGQSALNGIVRRLSIATNSGNLMESIESSKVRSLLVPKPYTLHESVVRQITTKYRLLKVFEARLAGETEVPEDLGSLNHLKYFSIRKPYDDRAADIELPKSIGMLENLETLDLRKSNVWHFPKEICKLGKLRHFLVHYLSLGQLKDCIGGMTSLQTLSMPYLEEDEFIWRNDILEAIQELGKLKQLKELALGIHIRKFMSVISSSINKMQQLEKLTLVHLIDCGDPHTFNDLDLNLPKLRYFLLCGYLEKLPKWIPKLPNLVRLKLVGSELREDSMELFKSMPNLLSLSFHSAAYIGRTLHFENEWFMNLKVLRLYYVQYLEYIRIDEGALPSLKKLFISEAHQLQRFPTDIQHLKKLEVLHITYVSDEFMQNFLLDGGQDHWIFKQVPFVQIDDREDNYSFVGGSRS